MTVAWTKSLSKFGDGERAEKRERDRREGGRWVKEGELKKKDEEEEGA